MLIDGDILLYQTTQSCLNEADWGDTYITCWLDLGELKYLVSVIINRWMETLDAESYTICLSDYERNFRKELDPSYKEQRDGSSKPIGYDRAHVWIQGEHPCKKLAGLEADDVMGILATNGDFVDPIIISDDKDMRQIPGRLYIPRRRELEGTTAETGLCRGPPWQKRRRRSARGSQGRHRDVGMAGDRPAGAVRAVG